MLFRDKKLKMIWRLKRKNKESLIIGSTHFFPYSFKKSLYTHIKEFKNIVTEGPLDNDSMQKVINEGTKCNPEQTLSHFIKPKDIRDIHETIFGLDHNGLSTLSNLNSLNPDTPTIEITEKILKSGTHWFVFFRLWVSFLNKTHGKIFHMDKEAVEIAKELNKDIYCLETIEEQIEALNQVPIENIINFLRQIKKWHTYFKNFKKLYLKGELEGIMNLTIRFPTRCESIIDKRDPIFVERMLPFLEEGDTLFIIGITHIPGITKRLHEAGIYVTKLC